MSLPLADAIRDARRAAAEERAAVVLAQRARAALRGLDLIAQQRRALQILEGLPGDDLAEELGAPAPPSPRAERVAARRAWLRSLLQRLEAEADDARRRSAALHDLQAAQRDILARPEHAGSAARLAALRDEQRRIADEQAALEWEVVQLETALRALDRLRDVLRAEEAGQGSVARHAELADAALGSLHRVLDAIDLDLPLPRVTRAPGVLPRIVRALGATRAELVGRLEPLVRARDERRHRHEALACSIEGETG